MTAKTSDWRPGPTVCRCCLTEGCYKDISTEYFWMGKREVYAEMLTDTLNVSIGYAKSGPNSNSRLICEPCISRLRDAHDFKRQVLECEKTFMQHLDPGSTSVLSDLQLTLEEVKIERVKQEKKISDDEDFDDRVDFVVNDDSDDDMDNEPLMKLASKVPKKEKEADLLELLDSSQITVKRKSTASSSKAKEPPAKKAKKREIVIKPSASKATASASKAGEKKKKENNAMSMARENAHTIVEYTTAYPFRLPESSIMCVYCCQSYQEPESFREHMQADHQEYTARHAFAHLSYGYLKVDITDLRCRICNEASYSLEDIAKHLNDSHCLQIDTEYELGLLPFHMERDRLSCPICEDRSANMRALSKHVQSHFFQCICEHCGKVYSSNTSLASHVRYSCTKSGKEKQRLCRKCKSVVSSLEEHLKTSALCRQHICSVCGERFGYWNEKQTHMEVAHGVPKRMYRCPECDMMFKNAGTLNAHFKISHTEDYLLCGLCGMKFDTRYRLDRHMLTHTGEKAFICNVCSKRFPRKSTLTQHMWIHSDVKRHECKVCDKTFNQKVCWKTHMKMRHPELYDPMC